MTSSPPKVAGADEDGIYLWDLLVVSVLFRWQALASWLLNSIQHHTSPAPAKAEEQSKLGKRNRTRRGLKKALLSASKVCDVAMLERLLVFDETCGLLCRQDLISAGTLPESQSDQGVEHGGRSVENEEDFREIRVVESQATGDLHLIPVLALPITGRAADKQDQVVGGGGAFSQQDSARCLQLLLQDCEGSCGFAEAVVAAAARGDGASLEVLHAARGIEPGVLLDVALFLACLCGSENCLKKLVEWGGNVDARLNVAQAIFAMPSICWKETSLFLHLVNIHAAVRASAVAALSASTTPTTPATMTADTADHARISILLDIETSYTALTVCSLLDRRSCARLLLWHGASPILGAEIFGKSIQQQHLISSVTAISTRH